MADKKQEISVPFCWEEVPGTPKKNWKMPTKTTSINKPPIKLLLPLPLPPAAAKSSSTDSSIPFKWEEKPGTPLPFFSSSSQAQPQQPQQQRSSSSSSSSSDDELTSPVSRFSDSDCYDESGEALIEWLFPVLSTKNSSYLNEGKRPLLTLGELMVMSTRRSYQKKIMDMHNSKSFKKETNNRKAYLCCINGLMDIILSSKPHMNWNNKQKQLKFA